MAWYSDLPVDMRADPSLTKFESVEQLARSYAGLQKMQGHPPDKLAVLPAADDAEGARKLLQKLGLPEKDVDYTIDVDKALPENYRDPASPSLKWFKERAFQLGILPSAASRLYNEFAASEIAGKKTLQDEHNKEVADGIKLLENTWGQAFNQNVAAANGVAAMIDRALGLTEPGKKLADVLDKHGLAAHPTVVKALAHMAKYVREDTVELAGVGTGGALSPAAAREKALELSRQSVDMSSKDTEAAKRLAAQAQKYFQLAAGA